MAVSPSREGLGLTHQDSSGGSSPPVAVGSSEEALGCWLQGRSGVPEPLAGRTVWDELRDVLGGLREEQGQYSLFFFPHYLLKHQSPRMESLIPCGAGADRHSSTAAAVARFALEAV